MKTIDLIANELAINPNQIDIVQTSTYKWFAEAANIRSSLCETQLESINNLYTKIISGKNQRG
jgi:hypothetical protein